MTLPPSPGAAALVDWTPVALNWEPPQPSIDWGDLRGIRFTEPFFQQTIERWARGNPRPLRRTGLDALAALDVAPAADPAGLIFHLSRCGSTLVSRLLSTLPGTLVISEPAPINTLLLNAYDEIAEEKLVLLLRALIRALGRSHCSDPRPYVLKLSSWNIRRIALFRRAFPDVPIVWVERAPIDVIASLLADPPGWEKLRNAPKRLQSLFGIDPRDANSMDQATFYVHALAAMLNAAGNDDGPTKIIDYRNLPEAIWSDVAPFFSLRLSERDVALMREEARYDSKSATPKPFVVKTAAGNSISDDVRALVAQAVDPLYRDRCRDSSCPP
jgi:hypothetical protein